MDNRQVETSKRAKILAFDPNGIGHPNGNLFGLPFTPEESDVVVIPVPWEVTISSRSGTACAPSAILEASYQIDLFDPNVPNAWKMGIAMLPIPNGLQKRNTILYRKARRVVKHQERGGSVSDPNINELLREINAGCAGMVSWVRENALEWIEDSKIVGVLGGDHSVALGLMEALAERTSYGATSTHTSISGRPTRGFNTLMRRSCEMPQPSKTSKSLSTSPFATTARKKTK